MQIYQINNFKIGIENNKITKIYYLEQLILSNINFLGFQKDIVSQILQEFRYDSFLNSNFRINNIEWNIYFKKNKYLLLSKSIDLNQFKNFFNIQLKIFVDKKDLIITLNYTSLKKFFWAINFDINFLENTKIEIKNNNNLIGIDQDLSFENNKIFLNKDIYFKINEKFKLVSSYSNFKKDLNKITFFPSLIGKKEDILKENQSYITNKNFYTIRISKI